MSVGAQIFIRNFGDRTLDFVAPSLEQLVGLCSRLYNGWAFYPLIPRKIPDGVTLQFVDVGACVGSWGIAIANRYPSVHVTCIEPVKDNYECLLHNAKGFGNIDVICAAADAEKGKIELGLPNLDEFMKTHTKEELYRNFGLMTAFGIESYAEEAETQRLDDMVGKVDFLKIDVEGMELRVMEGAQRILTEDRPVLQIENRESNQTRACYKPGELHEHILSLGYRYIGAENVDKIYIAKEKITDV